MDTFLQISGYILLSISILLCFGLGMAGCVIPVLPGHPLILLGILIAQFTIPGLDISWYHWTMLSLLCLLGVFGDNLFSLWGAKRFGSTAAGLWGCFAGILIGAFFFPWGLLLGPFLGALIAELIVSRQTLTSALKSGSGAFLGTIAGLLFKIIIGFGMLFYALMLYLV